MREPVTLLSYPTHIAAPHARTTLPQERAEIERMIDQFMKSGGVIERVPFGKVTGVESHMTARQMNARDSAIAKAKKRK